MNIQPEKNSYNPKATAKLKEWGINPDVASFFGLRYTGFEAFVYPSAFNHRKRVLFFKAGRRGKIMWDNTTANLPMAVLFNLENISTDTVYLANGEKSTLAMCSANISNVVNTFGEGNRLQEAIELLLAKGVKNVINLADCDNHGLQTALRWQQSGQAQGLNVVTLDMRPILTALFGDPEKVHKADSRDLWLLLGQDPAVFQKTLAELPHLEFERYLDELPQKPSPKKRPSNPQPDQLNDWAQAYDNWWRQKVLVALDRVSPPISNKRFRRCPNPHHEDKNPSFRITERGVPVCSCGIQHMAHPHKLLAEWVGALSWEEYKQEIIAQNKKTHPKPSLSVEYIFNDGIPDALRRLFLRIKKETYLDDHVNACLVYDLWHQAVKDHTYKPTDILTVNSVHAQSIRYKWMVHEKAIRLGLEQLAGLGIFKEIDHLIDGRGRPAKQYLPLPLEEAMSNLRNKLQGLISERIWVEKYVAVEVSPAWFPDDNTATAQLLALYENGQRQNLYQQQAKRRKEVERDILQEKLANLRSTLNVLSQSTHISNTIPIKTLRDYRKAYYFDRAIERARMKKPISVEKAAAEIGVSPKTLRKMRLELGIYAEPRFKEIPLTDAENVRDQVDTAAPWAADRHRGRHLESSSGRIYEIGQELTDFIDLWSKRELEQGYEIKIAIQIASQEQIASPELKEQMLLKYKLERERERERREFHKQWQAPPPAKKLQDTTLNADHSWGVRPKPSAICPQGPTPLFVWYQLDMLDSHRKEHDQIRAIVAQQRDLFPEMPFKKLLEALKGNFGNKWLDPPPENP